MYLVGVTGKIASGKGEVCRYLGKMGAKVINADEIAGKITGEKDTISLIIAEFGDEVVDESGYLDRSRLARMVFSDKEKLTRLNKLLLPRITDCIMQRLSWFSERDEIVVLEAPLLFQVELDRVCDFIVLVKSTRENRIKRLVSNKKMDCFDATLRVCGQNLRISEKKADLIIDNNRSLDELIAKAEEAYMIIRENAFRKFLR
ncbi:MAG: dephospho-CoA kinase [Actinobacteria bacterium]|nr:dephospho-CoA kinase [Actinomycetota bacterium]